MWIVPSVNILTPVHLHLDYLLEIYSPRRSCRTAFRDTMSSVTYTSACSRLSMLRFWACRCSSGHTLRQLALNVRTSSAHANIGSFGPNTAVITMHGLSHSLIFCLQARTHATSCSLQKGVYIYKNATPFLPSFRHILVNSMI